MSTLIGSTVRDFRRCWRQLVLTDVAYKIIAFILLTPLIAVLFRALAAASGNSVLADQDILFFFLRPVGWLCLITVGALWLGIVALELAALMAIVATAGQQRISLLNALRFALVKAWPVIRVAARLVAFTLLTIAPFLAVSAAAYFTLLTKYDINYYLREKPPVLFVTVGIGAVLVVTLLAVLVRLFTGWFFALPLVLFEDVSPSNALRVSRQRAHGHRRALLLWMLVWILAMILLSTMATTLVVGLALLFVPRATGSLALLLFAIGASLLLWAGVSLAVNLLSTTTFAAIHFNLYRHLGSSENSDGWRLNVAETSGGDFRFQLTPRRLLALGIGGIVVAFAIGILAVHSVRLEQRVVDIVEAHDMVSNVAVMSLKADALKKMRSVRPGWRVGQLFSVSAGNVQSIGADFLAVNASFADRRLIRAAHGSGKEVYVWTVNDAATMSTLIGRGVDGLITDKPALARSVLQQRARWSAPERLLLELAEFFGVATEIGEQ